MAMRLKFLGHAAFSVSATEGTVLIDPFLSDNPCAAARPEEVEAEVILVTHGHGDHLGDAVPISKRTCAPIVATFELANYCADQGAKVIDAHFGGVVKLPMGSVKLFPAMHSSSIDCGPFLGQAASFVLSCEGKHIYHAGDTALFGDMALISEEFQLDVACLPIGGHYTMGIDDAVRATKLLRPRKVVPMHYGTFEVIDADPLEFKEKVERATATECVILEPGGSLDL
jgi:L-ascorbate metabolism protein UlaG (beta-lactamase superfamily)